MISKEINKLSIRTYNLDLTGHSHDYHQIVFPLFGHQTLYISNRAINVSFGDGAVISKHTFHQFTAKDNFRFLVMDTDTLPHNILQFKDVIFSLDKTLLHYIQFIDQQLSNTHNRIIEKNIFDLLMQLLANLQWQPSIDTRLKPVIQILNNHPTSKHSINALADMACLSPSHFKTLFKQQINSTPMQYLTKLRMDKAMSLIKHTDLPIYKIAEECGYQDVSAFSRRFLQTYQQPPSHFRH